MNTDPVRLSVDLTWWPGDATFSMSRRLWTRPGPASDWQLEDMATSGSPIAPHELEDRFCEVVLVALQYFTVLTGVELVGPFSDAASGLPPR
jgi:hypothetical protein